MNDLITLLKYDLINSYNINSILNRKNKKEKYKILSFLILMIFAGISFEISMFSYFNLMVEPLKSIDMLYIIAIQGFMISIFIILGTSIYKSPGLLFGMKDFEFLISLPIKPWVILSIKIINLILIDYLFLAISLIPALIVYFINTEVTFIMIINAIIMYIFIPFIPIVIASLIGFVFTYILSKVRYKNILYIVEGIILIPFIFFVSSNIEFILNYIFKNAESINDILFRIYPPLKYYINGIVYGSFSGALIFILISISTFTVFIILLNRVFVKINSKLLENYKKNSFKMKKVKEYNILRTLLNKEFIRYISKPVVVLNTSIGMVLYLLSVIGILFIGDEFINIIFDANVTKEFIPLLLIVQTSLFVALSNTTSSSISLEGSQFLILKSLPIDFMYVFKEKMLLNNIITIIPILIGSLIFTVKLNLSVIQGLWLLIIPTLISLFMAKIGLIINLIFPKMVWISEVIVVKRSISVMLTLLIGILTVLVPSGIYYLIDIKNTDVYLLVVSIIFILFNLIAYKILNGFGREKIKNIN